MYWEQRQQNEATIIECFGRFDEEDTNHFIQTLEQLGKEGVKNIIINFAPVFYLDRKNLSILLFAKELFQTKEEQFALLAH